MTLQEAIDHAHSRAGCETQCQQEHAQLAKWLAELDTLRDKVTSLEKDAVRYRWLREQPNNTTAPRIDVVYWTEADESANEGEGLRMEQLDDAIDDMQAKEEQK